MANADNVVAIALELLEESGFTLDSDVPTFAEVLEAAKWIGKSEEQQRIKQLLALIALRGTTATEGIHHAGSPNRAIVEGRIGYALAQARKLAA